MRTADSSPTNIVALADAGVRVVIDDFGTGFSNFGYLTRFPVRTIKIDREFVARLALTRGRKRSISALIGLAEELGIQTIGEGIEMRSRATTCCARGCAAAGYFWGGRRPVAKWCHRRCPSTHLELFPSPGACPVWRSATAPPVPSLGICLHGGAVPAVFSLPGIGNMRPFSRA